MRTISRLLTILVALAISLAALAPSALAEDNDHGPNQDVDIAACEAAGGEAVIHSGTNEYIACVFPDDGIICNMYPGGGPIICEWLSGEPPARHVDSTSIGEAALPAATPRNNTTAPIAPTSADATTGLMG